MGCCLFKREHHQRIAALLSKLDGKLLRECDTYFAGGTAIVLSHGLEEYRESVDVDFLCGSSEGYRKLREAIREKPGLQGVATDAIDLLREVKTDQYGIRTFASIDGVPLKLEFVLEGRIKIEGEIEPAFGVPVLGRSDMYAEKLLANDDRQGDRQSMHRDIIDLAMMIEGWGSIPAEALAKAEGAYGNAILKSFAKATETLSTDREYLASCIENMRMDAELVHRIPAILEAELYRLSPARARLAPQPPASELIEQSESLRNFLAENNATVQQGNYESGRYVGRILWTDAHCLVQDVGRGIVVLHPTEHWHTPPAKGTYARVHYQHGVPDWTAVDLGRTTTCRGRAAAGDGNFQRWKGARGTTRYH